MSWFRKHSQKLLPPRKREVHLVKLEELHKAEDKETREEIEETKHAINTMRAKKQISGNV